MKNNAHYPLVYILILHFNDPEHLLLAIESAQKQNYPNKQIVVIDNHSEHSPKKFLSKLSNIETLYLEKNLGYATANNLAMDYAFLKQADYVLLQNADIELQVNCLSEMMKLLQKETGQIGLIQPKILLQKKKNIINTDGNAIHILGFGYCKNYKREDRKSETDHEILSASGACLLISRQYYRSIGKFDENFFLYNEDQAYSWKGLLLGYHHYLCANAIAYHDYSFAKNKNKMFFSESNRLSSLIMFYSLRTLFILFPIFLVTEIGILMTSILEGWFFVKIQSYLRFFGQLPLTLRKRNLIQTTRKLSDEELMKAFDKKLNFAEFSGKNIDVFNYVFEKYINLFFKAF
jgi:GT2 family glycosyltransferase